MKKATLTAAAATSFTTNEARTKLNIKFGTAYEIDGGWYGSLGLFIRAETGVRVTVRAHGPRMGELYGLKGNLNSLGLHIRTSETITEKQRKAILKAAEFFLNTITVQRTVLTKSKSRAELREASTAHKYGKNEMGEALTIYGITTYVVAL